MTSAILTRLAQAADIPAIAQVHLDASKIAYRDILGPALVDGLTLAGRIALWERRFAGISLRGRLRVLCAGSQIIGFALCDASQDAGAESLACELKSLYLAPAHWRAGHGVRLIDLVSRDFQRRGFEAMILWTIRLNVRARGFYEHIGFHSDDVTRVTRRVENGLCLEYEEMRYSRPL